MAYEQNLVCFEALNHERPWTLEGYRRFGGLFRVPASSQPGVLVASADGVGTKVKVAIESGRHDTIGHDLVNHCVNDILVQGATPESLPNPHTM